MTLHIPVPSILSERTPYFLAGHITLPREQSLYFSAFLVANCGHETTFWPMHYKRKCCVRLMGSFLKERVSTLPHCLPPPCRLECKLDG